MTLLSIVQQACNSVPIAAPSVIVGNATDQTALATLAWANEAGNSIARRNPGGWVSMVREHDFQTVSYGPLDGTVANVGGVAVVTLTTNPGVAENSFVVSGTGLLNNSVVVDIAHPSPTAYEYTTNLPPSSTGAGTFTFSQTDYALPEDFARAIDGTFWDRTRYWQMRGALSPQNWQLYRSSIYGKASIERRWRFRNSDWLSSMSGTPSTNILSIDPTPIDNGSILVFEYNSNGWCANADTGARQTQWLADDDVGVIDEYLIYLSVKWRLLRRMGVSYQEEKDEYDREVDLAVARDGGTAVLNMTPAYGIGLLTPLAIQDGNFPSSGT